MTNEELIAKYNKPVPRYTSYPPANSFVEMGEEEYLAAVDQSNNAAVDNISFYIHVPFCQHLCHYCGCNSVAMARNEVVEAYFDALHREINLLLPHLDKGRKISQIHYGGGSPTSIPLHHIKRLNEHLLGSFGTIENPEIAIECHPAYLNDEHWEQLIGCGFTRYSLGIQDFDDNVLRTVNRRPSLLPVEHIVERLRQSGAKVNLDFIYGLPGQTVQSFARTIARAIDMRPNRLVTFSYAHVPYIYSRQRILEKAGLQRPKRCACSNRRRNNLHAPDIAISAWTTLLNPTTTCNRHWNASSCTAIFRAIAHGASRHRCMPWAYRASVS